MKKVISGFIAFIAGLIIGASAVGCLKNKTIMNNNKMIDKFKKYYKLLNQWMILKNNGNSLKSNLEKYGYKTIAIYGMGEIGNRLYEDLKNTGVNVLYAIDKEAGSKYSEIEVVTTEDILKEVDAIIVTPVFDFNKIEEELSDKTSIKIISLEDIL